MASARTTAPPIPPTFISTASPTSFRCLALAKKKRAPNCCPWRMLIRHPGEAAATSASQRLSQARPKSSANVQTLPLRQTLAFRQSPCQTRRVVIGLFPELDAPGGVQRAGRHLAAVLTEFAASRGMECPLLTLNDSPELHRMTLAGREFVFTGCERSKGRFTATALRAARRKAKLVLAAHPNLAPVVQMMRIAAPRMKSIVCAHGADVWEPLGILQRVALQHSSLVLVPSKDTAAHVAEEQGVPEERIRVLPWGLDPQFEALISPGSHPVLPENFPSGRVILSVGRWLGSERYKGMDPLITALPRLLTQRPEVQLALVGAGDDRAWLEDLAEQTGMNRHVHFLTGLTYSEIAACYAACEIFALPSRGEGFGLV